MSKTQDTYITMGKVGATYGVRGWLKIHSYAEFGPSILDYKHWFLSSDQKLTPIEIEESKIQGKHLLVKIAGIETPEEARTLTGKTIQILREELPKLPQNEYYWSDLIGLTVINKNNQVLGKVIYLIATGSNDVLVIKNDKEHAIPYLWNTVILSVDLTKGEIHVDWELI